MLINNQYQAPLSQHIQKEYNNIMGILVTIEPTDRVTKKIDGAGGKVSVADLIAYQIGWGTLLLGWYKAGLQETMPEMPGEGFVTWDYVGLARHFYKKYQYDSYRIQEQEFHKIVNAILDMVEHEYQAHHLDVHGIWPWCTLASGKQWPLSKWITVNTVSPYKRSATLIRKFLKSRL